jgi:hypothetical protein
VHGPSARVALEDGRGDVAPDHRAILAKVTLVAREARDLAAHDALLLFEILRAFIRDHELGEVATGELLARVAEELAEARIAFEKSPLEIGEDHSDGRVLERAAEAALALLQCTLRRRTVAEVYRQLIRHQGA